MSYLNAFKFWHRFHWETVQQNTCGRYFDKTVSGLGKFCSFVFGHEMLSYRCDANSLKLLSDVVASMADGRNKAVSST